MFQPSRLIAALVFIGTAAAATEPTPRLSRPLDLKPAAKAEVRAVVENLTVKGSRATFHVRLGDGDHLMASSVRLKASDSSGKVLFEVEEPGWFLFEPGTQPFSVRVPESFGRPISTVAVEVKTAHGTFGLTHYEEGQTGIATNASKPADPKT